MLCNMLDQLLCASSNLGCPLNLFNALKDRAYTPLTAHVYYLPAVSGICNSSYKLLLPHHIYCTSPQGFENAAKCVVQ